MINAHYSQLRDLPTTSTYYEKLRSTYDQIERHLRSLQVLGQNIENNFMFSLIQSKLPRTILAKLEEYKNTDAPWTVTSLRKELKKYLSAEEVGDRLVNFYRKGYISVQDRNHDNRRDKKFQHQTKSEHHSTGSFATREMNKRSCYYCGKNHWSDECKQYPDIKSRKKKANGCCFICLKKGHLLKECTSTRP